MTTIAYYSLATNNDSNELSSRIEFHSLALRATDKPTIVPPAVSDKPLSEVLDEVQGTRRIVRTPSNPPSGRGSNTPTLPPSSDDAETLSALLSIY